MRKTFEDRLSGLLAGWARLTRGAALWVVLASLLAATGSVVYAAGHLGINADITSLLGGDAPYLKYRRDYERTFPLLADVLLVVVDADTPERAARAVDRLGERFASEPQTFESVFVPGGGKFFAQNALLYLKVDELEDLADHLAKAQPYVAELGRDPSLRGLFGLLGQTLRAIRRGDVEDLDPAPLLDRVSAALEATLQGGTEPVAWGELMLGDAAARDATRRIIVLSPVLDFHELQPAARAVEAVHRVVAQAGLASDPRVRVRLTGDFALSYDEMAVVRSQAAAAGVASFVAVALLLVVALRSAWLIFSTLVTLLVGLACSLGFAAVAVGHLNPISVAFAVLFIGLSVDFGIHLCLRYRELRARGEPHGEAIVDTARGVGSSLVLCAFTTMIGFYAFVPTEFTGVAELGLIAGTGMAISLAFSLTLLPALLQLAPARVQASWSRGAPPPARGRRPFAQRHARPIRVLAVGVALGCLALLPGAHFDHNPLRVRDPNSESVQALEDLLESSDTSPWSISVMARNRVEARKLAHKLQKLDVVSRTVTPDDFVPRQQDAKLDIIEDIAFFLGPLRNGPDPPPTPDQELQSIADLRSELASFVASGTGDDAVGRSAKRMQAALAAIDRRVEGARDPDAELQRLDTILVEPIRWRLEMLRDALRAEPVTFDDLPRGMLAQTVGNDGRVRIEVLPTKDLNDQKALTRFVDEVRSVEPAATGLPVHYLESARSIVRSFRQALISAAVVIAVLLWLLWQRVGDTLIVMSVLGLAALLTTGVAVLLGIPFNFADVIVLPLLLGIGVDSSIHLVHRYRSEVGGSGDLIRTSTARAVLFSALTTIASFGSLGFTTHRGMATMGQLLTIGVVAMLVCNLVVLPALLTPRRARTD